MVQINFALREVNCKVVYYGPGMSGKTTNLEVVHRRAPEGHRGDLTSIATEGDRTLFFDFMPLDLGTIAGMKTKFQLYTVPGQVYYNSTRKLVLQGVDGVVFVADSSPSKMVENLQSIANLEENLREYGRELKDLPHILQFNKRDLPDAMPTGEMNRALNKYAAPAFEAVATTGEGVFPTLKALASAVLESINRMDTKPKVVAPTAPPPAAPAIHGPIRPAHAPVAAAASVPAAPSWPARPLAAAAAASAPSPASGGPFSRFGIPPDSLAQPAEGTSGFPGRMAPAASMGGIENSVALAAPPKVPMTGTGDGGGGSVAPLSPPLSRPTAPAARPSSEGRGAPLSSPRLYPSPRVAAPRTAPPPRGGTGTGSNVVYAAVFGALVTAAAFGVFLLFR